VAPTEGGDDDESGVMQAGRDFPLGVLTSEGEQIDLREKNSWSLHLDEVSTREFLEVQVRVIILVIIIVTIVFADAQDHMWAQAVNAIAPFLTNGRRRGLMKRSPPLASDDSGAATPEAKFIVNVSAMEGQFYRYKTDRHPHTNMAKARCPCNPTFTLYVHSMRLTINIPFWHQAALNMMTRTSGPDYAADGIYMTSVDTGWVTDGACSPSLLIYFRFLIDSLSHNRESVARAA
jgi:NAD(P)-dependent dehydrogenase (short-subunit alcohol dehydrogenase family)